MSTVNYRRVVADGVDFFYREAGIKQSPTLLLLHGFPTSSHMFRDLIPQLAGQFHVVAPDLPGFGFTEVAEPANYPHTFARLAESVDAFTQALGLDKYALYVFDYGAPVGFRLAVSHPERVTAVVSQNGNAYVEGLSEGWNPIRAYWRDPSDGNRAALRGFLTPDATRMQYEHGVKDTSKIAPESYTLDSALLARAGNDQVQLDLFKDYASNIEMYPAFQKFLRDYKPPVLATWGQNDPFFLPAGAEAFKRDVPGAEVHFYDTGHFTLETHAAEIGATIVEFLSRNGRRA